MSRVQLMLSWLQQSDTPPVRTEDPAGQNRSKHQGSCCAQKDIESCPMFPTHSKFKVQELYLLHQLCSTRREILVSQHFNKAAYTQGTSHKREVFKTKSGHEEVNNKDSI